MYTKNKSRFPKSVEYGDIVTGLPLPDDSCKVMYCSHVLEHLSLEGFRKALKNTYAKLQHGGIFRLVLPDLEFEIKQYFADHSCDAALSFMRTTSLGQEVEERNLKNFLISWLGNSAHLWMWDYKSIEQELINAGFVDIRRAYFGDSSDEMIDRVEDESRWDNCLGAVCVK